MIGLVLSRHFTRGLLSATKYQVQGVTMGRFATILTLLALAAVTPTIASAQGAIAGVVTDTSGAVLPGVTVEAASPALIERVRSAVTDERGEYRIIELISGTYT